MGWMHPLFPVFQQFLPELMTSAAKAAAVFTV
jgi:hypothetical protein